MDLFPFAESGTPVLVSASESGLFLHPVRNERFGHPFLLCSAYKNGFSGCIYNDSLYYTYINKENSLLLRRLHDSVIPFRLDGTDSITYHTPHLITFKNTLFLFYLEARPDGYRIKLHLPFSDTVPQLPESLQAPFSQAPLLSLQATGQYLYLFLTEGTTVSSYRYSSSGCEPLCTKEELLSELQLPWESEKKQLEQALLRAVHLSEQQQNLLTEKEQKLQTTEAKLAELVSEAEQTGVLLSETTHTLQIAQAQLKECEQSREQTVRELNQTSRLLERAKAQYNELMQVAEQYRQEAAKWYGKFTDRI